MDKEKRFVIGKKIESFAYGGIGIGIFSYGTSYFQEQTVYNVPRLLIPIFEIFGNIGLAIGMLILGGALIYWGFTMWKKVSENSKLYWIIIAIGLVVCVSLANINFSPNKSTDNIMEEMNKSRETQMEELRNVGELSFRNAFIDEHVDKFTALYKRFEQSVKDKDEEAINDCEEKFMEWLSNGGEVVQGLTTEELTEWMRYNAKLNIQWHDVRELQKQ